jgi:nicotinic acid mononucleotide adenylyltransferase
VLLWGNAFGVLCNLPKGKTPQYGELVKVSEERFGTSIQTELYRVQKKKTTPETRETFLQIGQAIRRLVNVTYAIASSDIRKTLSKDQYVDALVDSEMQICIK